MKHASLPLLAALLAAPLAGPAFAAPPHPPRAEIPFADHGGVEDWQAEGDHVIYFQDSHNRWFRAELFSPAFDLPFTETIGIDSGPTGTLDKFGAILVRGQRYPFRSFEPVAGPPKGKRHKWKAKDKHG